MVPTPPVTVFTFFWEEAETQTFDIYCQCKENGRTNLVTPKSAEHRNRGPRFKQIENRNGHIGSKAVSSWQAGVQIMAISHKKRKKNRFL